MIEAEFSGRGGAKYGSAAPQIAILDDDESVLDALSNLINALGFEVDAFASAEEFLASGLAKSTDCVIADVHMSGITGIQLLERLNAMGANAPVILVTAYPQESARDHVLRLGAVGYLTKPLREDSLVACIDQALGRSGTKPN